MQTFPQNVKPGSNATLASLVYGNRFHADQTLIEYLIEFLLIFCAEKDSEGNGKLAFHDPYSHEELSYTVEPRMGLKRFIFFDKSKRNDSATVDKIAYQELLAALSNKIDDTDSAEKTEFLEALQDLFHGYAVVIRKRTWCAQAMLPVCPEVIFCEAMPKKKVRETLDWDKLCHDPDMKQREKIDTEFDFDKRNFLARGGELYYLHILLGLQGQEEKRAKLEWLLNYLLMVQGKKMSNIAEFIQKTWEETMDYDESPKQRLRLAYIPEQAYREIASDSVDELISFLSCNMHPIKKLELLANGIMLQVMRMLAVATTTHIGAPRECWIIDMKGSTEDIIKKIAASNFRNVENTFVTALGQQSIQMEREDIERRMQEVRKARKDSLEIFRSKGKELQCIIPTTGPYERFSLPEDSIRFLVLAIIRPGNKMTMDMFLSKLYDNYGIVIGPTEYKQFASKPDNPLANSFAENKCAFQKFLKATGFLHELSDATSVVINPYDEVEEDERL